ncbi:MAG TPA: DUF4262 domain-containing protein [Euzebya sp.]|nr:DUF4262 domain-containing protein [Euzebya sp.]
MATFTDPTAAYVARLVRRHGWAVMAVGTGECAVPGCCGGGREDPFAYTIGLHAHGRPELLVHGCDADDARAVLNDLATSIIDGEDVTSLVPVLAGARRWIPVPATPRERAQLRFANLLAGRSRRRPVAALRLDPT